MTLAFNEAGKGTAVVLLHGFPLDSTIWMQQKQQLSQRFRVITPDLRGHGRNPAPEGVYEMSSMARDVVDLLDSLDIKKAVIMGHSMGGYVALAAWNIAPERFLGLGLIASQAGADSEEGRQGRYKTAEKVAAEGSKVIADAMIPELFAPDADVAIVESVRQLILKTAPAGIIGTLKGMAVRADSTSVLPTINVPVLILAGEKDAIIPPTKAEAMASALPSATLVMVANAGHMPMLEQPEATTTAMSKFLAAF